MRPVKVQPLQNPSVSSIKLHPLLRPQLCSIRLHPTLNAKTCTLFIKFIPLLSVADLPAGRQVMFLGHIFIDLTSKTSFQIGSECNIDTQPRPFSYFELTCFAHATPQVTDFAIMQPRRLKLPICLRPFKCFQLTCLYQIHYVEVPNKHTNSLNIACSSSVVHSENSEYTCTYK